jgi:hypothetical protein
MPKRSFVLMMLLAASLIGISSATNFQPEVATGQPQPQSPNTAPPTLGKRPAAPQGLQQQQSDVGRSAQMLEDKALVDRLFPYIIQKIDGKTLAQKIDGGLLAQKIDGGLLAQKIFPYLDLISSVKIRYGPYKEVVSSARCLPGEQLVGGGYQYGGDTDAIVTKTYPLSDNQGLAWLSTYNAGEIFDSKIVSYVTCLSTRIALKGVQEPTTPPPVLR